MQVCFIALDNFVNETAYDVLKEQGFNIIPYLRKSVITKLNFSKQIKFDTIYTYSYTVREVCTRIMEWTGDI